jgi:hypothetical protein
LKPVRILSDFISYLSDSNVICFKRSDEVEQLLLESVLENHNLLAQYRSNYKSQLNLVTVLNMLFLEKTTIYLVYILIHCPIICPYLKKSALNQLSIC